MKLTLEECKKRMNRNGSLDLGGCTSLTSLPEGLTVSGNLFLRDCTSLTSLPEGLTVSGSLDLICCTSLTSLPEGLTVSEWLDLSGCTSLTSLPEDALIGGRVYADFPCKKKPMEEGEYITGRAIMADGILTPVREKRQILGYTWYTGRFKGKNLISDGTYYANCKTFSEGVRDIEFKKSRERGAEQYSELTVESEVTADEAAAMYRIITGACQRGTEDFIASLEEVKEKYNISEIIEMTKDQYGGRAFAEFFGERE